MARRAARAGDASNCKGAVLTWAWSPRPRPGRAAEKALDDTKLKIRGAKRESRTAASVQEQKQAQERVRTLERQQRRQRQQIFEVEDAIETRRDQLIDALEQRLHRSSTTHHGFTIRWRIN